MPEKPEVVTVANKLKQRNLNKVITSAKVRNPGTIDYPDVSSFEKRIVGQTIHEITTRGKWIVIKLDRDYLLIHLRMTGKFFYRTEQDAFSPHEHVILTLNGTEQLRFHDMRKFGKMKLIPKDKIDQMPPFTELGLEAWDPNLTAEYLKTKWEHKAIPVKTALLDQKIITGIGNIYADEILFLSKVNPLTPSSQISKSKLKKIIECTIQTLDKAIAEGGTTIRNYTSEEGVTGLFQNHLYVHLKEGQPCSFCQTPIKKIRIGGRSTYYCPKCQRKSFSTHKKQTETIEID